MPDEGSWLSRILPSPLRRLEGELTERLGKAPLELNEFGYDPYGFHAPSAIRMLLPSALMYRYYFRVETHGCERVPPGAVLLIANHSGQVGYDGMMLAMAMLLEAKTAKTRDYAEILFRPPGVGPNDHRHHHAVMGAADGGATRSRAPSSIRLGSLDIAGKSTVYCAIFSSVRSPAGLMW